MIMRRGVFSTTGWSKSNGLFVVICTLTVLAVAGLSSTRTQADAPVPPVFDGAMAFPMIDGPAGPEEFSWRVALSEDQELESIDDQHAEVYYVNGHHPAFGIFAEPAHDADGSNVPTTISVSEGDVITLTVHHRAGDPNAGGAPFTYPITAGQGWEGGYQTFIVSGPPDEQDLRESERRAREEREAGQPKATSANCLGARMRGRTSRKRLKRTGCKKPAKGEIGGPPSIPLGPPDEGRRTSPYVVVGRGDSYGGPVELVAYGWLPPRDAIPSYPRKQLCLWVEYLPKEISPGICGSTLDPGGDQKIVIDDRIRALGKPAERFTEVGGRLTPDVASVRVSYRRAGHQPSTATATVAQVSGEMQRMLHQASPFGYFAAKIRGQVSWRSIRVHAYDDSGAMIGVVP